MPSVAQGSNRSVLDKTYLDVKPQTFGFEADTIEHSTNIMASYNKREGTSACIYKFNVHKQGKLFLNFVSL